MFSGSGAVSMGHFDGSCPEEGVIGMIQRVQELSLGYPDGRLEVHIVGGFHDARGRSDEVLAGLLCNKSDLTTRILKDLLTENNNNNDQKKIMNDRKTSTYCILILT
jgi:hypothetical protein